MIFDSAIDFYGPSSFIVYFLSEVSNLIFCFLIVFIFLALKKLNFKEALFWVSLFTIAFIINLFINANQFPDIGGYLRCMRDLRDNLYFDELGCQIIQSGGGENLSLYSFKRGLPAIIYSFIPMPSLATHASIGLINKLYLFFLYLFIKPKVPSKNLLIFSALFVLPSMLLYSSLGLRDNIIFCTQVVLLFSIIGRKFFVSTILLLILSAIKIQNGLVFSFLYFGIFFFQASRNFKTLLLYCSIVLISMIAMGDILLATINYFKLAFLSEDNMIASVTSENYVPFTSVISLFATAPISFIEGMIRPIPSSPIALVFAVESIIQIWIIFTLMSTRFANLIQSPEFIIILLTFAIGIVLNTVVIENEFTYLRYKYTFVSMFIIYLLCEKTRKQKNSNYLE